MNRSSPFTILFLTCCFFLFFNTGSAFSAALLQAARHDTSSVHELTIYAVPSLVELNWDSPSTLLKSAANSFFMGMFVKTRQRIGHIIIEFKTPLLDSVFLSGFTTAPGESIGTLAMKEHVGLGVLGATVKGHLEHRAYLEKRIKIFAAKKKIAFIKYRISEEAALRVKKYLEGFTKENEKGYAPSSIYGGALWPRNEDEGAGCSAFGISALDVAGININHPDWMVSVNIPMDLVGGNFNNNRKVRILQVNRRDHWHDGSGTENVDYILYSIYDPSLVFRWILNQRKLKGELAPIENNNIPGLYYDARNIKISEFEPVFIKREKSSPFIDFFRKSYSINGNKSSK